MNIFILDWDQNTCARYHNDKHVVKMVLEVSQLLCGVHWATGGNAQYKLTHKNHPCAIWAREDLNNYMWLCELGLNLCREYTHRYGKTHKSYDVIMWCRNNHPIIPNIKLTEAPTAMPDQYKVPGNVVQSYRNYYKGEKSGFAKWKNREIPKWFTEIYE
jgi:hypothetical protein